MVKKVNRASLKMSKNDSKKQLNSLIKVLRPKVYITDSSNFKRLVQQLTGNDSAIQPSPPSPTTQHLYGPVINVEDDLGEPQSSMEAVSFDDELFSNICLTEGLFTELIENQQMENLSHLIENQQMENLSHDPTKFEASYSMDEWADWLACQDVESWLLDIDQTYPKFDGFAQNIQEASVYDYELSGLVSGTASF